MKETTQGKTRKCPNCKGSGLTSLGEGIRGLGECPRCKGTGKIAVRQKEDKE